MPALRASLCCSPVAGRQKLADAQTVWRLIPPPALLLGGIKRGAANVHVHVSGTRFPEEPFYFFFNMYGKKILIFVTDLVPMTCGHQKYLYRGCTGTVAVVFYGTLFNMLAQGQSMPGPLGPDIHYSHDLLLYSEKRGTGCPMRYI